MKPFYVYMLRCCDGSFYVGQTDDLEKRIAMHRDGTCPGYTAQRRPVELVFADEFFTRQDAIERERQLKGWSRAKKEALIRGDWIELHRLAQRYGSKSRNPASNPPPTGASFDSRAARAAQDER